jgi:hypothetical protein
MNSPAVMTPQGIRPSSTPPSASTAPVLRTLQPPSTLIIGAPGSGKTDVIATYAKAGIETFVITTEPGGVESLIDSATRRGAPIEKLHWSTIFPHTGDFTALETMTKDIGDKDYEGISKLKGIGKDKTRVAAMNLLNAMKDFKCERTGDSYGSFTTWDNSAAFVIDSLSGINLIAWYLTVGYKPTAMPGEWNIAQNWVEALLNKINSDRGCYFTLTAHVEKEMDEMSGTNRVMVSTLGRKLAPKIPRFFSEVVFASRSVKKTDKGQEATFLWSTVEPQMDLKNRSLPISDKITPDFSQLVSAYTERLKKAGLGTTSK